MNCDPIARWYRALEYLGMGRALERRRSEFLPQLALQFAPRNLGEIESARALLLGDGDGRFLCDLLAACPAMRIDCVESSAKMLALAERRAIRRVGASHAADRARFILADAREWRPSAKPTYQLISTHFFLDCLTNGEVERLLTHLESSLCPSTVWIVSEFAQPKHGLSAWRARLWIGGLYRLFGLCTGLRVRRLPDHHTVFKAHGFHLKHRGTAEWGLLISEWWERQP